MRERKGEKEVNDVSRREGRSLIAGSGNLHESSKRPAAVWNFLCYRQWRRHRRRRSPKEVVRACVPPTMYSAGTFGAHNNGPRWGETRLMISRWDVPRTQPIVPSRRLHAPPSRFPLSNATRYASVPTIGELQYTLNQLKNARKPMIRNVPPHLLESNLSHCQTPWSALPRQATGTPTIREFRSNVQRLTAIHRVHKKNTGTCT